MQITSESGTERNLAVELILEDIPGGGVVEKDDFPSTQTEMEEGALLGVDSNGIYHIVKTAKLVDGVATTGTSFLVYNNHEFKVGDYIGNSTSTNASGVAITAIAASGTGKDVIVATWNGPAIAASGLIVAASGLGHSPFKYTPVAIATNTVDLSADNTGCGLLVRGRVRESVLPYAVDSTLKGLLPLIRFV